MSLLKDFSNLIQLVLGQSFAELAINVEVEVDWHPNPDAVQKHKDEPKVLDLVARIEGGGPILQCVHVHVHGGSGINVKIQYIVRGRSYVTLYTKMLKFPDLRIYGIISLKLLPCDSSSTAMVNSLPQCEWSCHSTPDRGTLLCPSTGRFLHA